MFNYFCSSIGNVNLSIATIFISFRYMGQGYKAKILGVAWFYEKTKHVFVCSHTYYFLKVTCFHSYSSCYLG